jgi:two-component system response regulator (stage 0 sporulation protein A)
MDRKRILIADGSREFRQGLSEALCSLYQTQVTWDGISTLQQLHSFQPDILVLDLMMPGLDGITLLQTALSEDIRPVVLATTRYLSDYIVSCAEKMGVSYLMVKPCDISAVVSRIADMTQRIQPTVFAQLDCRTLVSNMLMRLGVPTKLKGYNFLREAILIMSHEPTQSITKELYPSVASACHATPVQIERSIRSAISVSWSNRDEGIWRLYFSADGSSHIPRPSNGAFISQLADRLILE